MDRSAYIRQTLQKLVQINSVNPSLEPGGGGEEEIGRFISAELSSLGIQHEIDPIADKRINVTATIPGSGSGKSLILNAHMDTVGTAGMDAPFSGTVINGRLYGRGSYDMKASIAAILSAAKTLIDQDQKLGGDLILSFVADEEFESIGAKRFVENHRADAAIVTEPTDLQICLAHRGFGVFKMITHGKTAHGGKHRLGVDANTHMGLLLAELHKYGKKLPEEMNHPLCGEASMHVPLIEGGNSLFIYSNRCTAHLERRTLPGETEQSVMGELNHIIQSLQKTEPDFNVSIESLIWRDPYEIDRNRPIVKHVESATKAVLEKPSGVIGHTWWEDSGIFGKAGIDTVILGPKGGGIHEAKEWVELESVEKLSKILYRTVLDFCR